ncbi:hypothetical protein GCM10009533_40850 [Saccharopolyspora spinosporotrichia]|uniref:Uncharacterized protein n=1 Tax=Saccharopolyspora erythraea TaxID=1836 RepID=A0ABN1D8V8_SACER
MFHSRPPRPAGQARHCASDYFLDFERVGYGVLAVGHDVVAHRARDPHGGYRPSEVLFYR